MQNALTRIYLAGARPPWLRALFGIALLRLFLNIPALVGANLFPIRDSVLAMGLTRFGSLPELWARWDSGYYLKIAQHGYALRGTELAFMPVYPLLIWLLSLGSQALEMWVGFIISNVAFLTASLLLWKQISIDYDSRIAHGTIITLGVFPTSFFFSAIYTESLFLLFSVLVFWYSMRRRYWLAAVFVALASLTRINGFVLAVIPVAELLVGRPPHYLRGILATGVISGIGLASFAVYLWISQGNALMFLSAQQAQMKRSVVLPWQGIWDSLTVVVTGRGGFDHNWFMRVVSVQDLLATILFLVVAIVGFRSIRKSLAAYLAGAMLALLTSHGPYTLGLYSMSRYVLALFPGFVVLSLWLDRAGRLKWIIWGGALVVLCFLTAWFANGGWVA